MSRKLRRTMPAALFLAFAGCFGVINQPFMRAAAPAAPAVATAPAAPAAEPTSEKATVYFHRTAGSVQTRFPIWDRDTFVGFSTPTTTVVYECDPGEHLLIAQAESPELVRATLAAGKVYDILIEGRMGMRQARVTMTPITANHRLRARLALYDKIPKVKANPASTAAYEKADRPAVQRYLKGLEPRLGSMNIAVIRETDGR